MNLKTKAVGLLAGSALALSVATGAMATPQDSTVTLASKDEPTGCSAGTISGGNFGTIKWDGSQYPNPNTSALTVPLNFDSADPDDNRTCSVSVYAESVFSGTGSNTDEIPASALKLDDTAISTSDQSQSSLGSSVNPASDASGTLSLDLTGVTVSTDTYTNTLTITVGTNTN